MSEITLLAVNEEPRESLWDFPLWRERLFFVCRLLRQGSLGSVRLLRVYDSDC